MRPGPGGLLIPALMALWSVPFLAAGVPSWSDPAPEASRSTIDGLVRQLEAEGWSSRAEEHDDGTEYRVSLSPPPGLMPSGSVMILRLLFQRGQLVVYATRAKRLPDAASLATAGRINRLNATMAGASFELDRRDGDLRCRMGLDYTPRPLVAAQVAQIFHSCAAAWNAGLPRLDPAAAVMEQGHSTPDRPGTGTTVMALPPDPEQTLRMPEMGAWVLVRETPGLWRSAWRGTGPVRRILLAWDQTAGLYRIDVFPGAGDAGSMTVPPALRSLVLARFLDWNWDLRLGAFILSPGTAIPRFRLAFPARGLSAASCAAGLASALILACRTLDSFHEP